MKFDFDGAEEEAMKSAIGAPHQDVTQDTAPDGAKEPVPDDAPQSVVLRLVA